MRRYCTVAVGLGIALAFPAAANAATFTVDRDSDDPADGDCSVAGGPCTLRGAVLRANATPGADRIELGARTVVLSHESGDLDVSEELTIAGAGPAVSVIDGSGIEDRIVSAAASLTVEGVRLTRGQNGAIGFYPAETQDALAARAEAAAATLVVTDSTFDDNRAVRGGAIDITPGFGIDSRVVVSRSTFSGNRALFDGEGAARGGAIAIDRGALDVENSTFTDNVVEGGSFRSGGGALAVNGPASATLTHVTIAGNRAEGRARGGGIAGPLFETIGAQSFVPVTVTNSIVAGNQSEIEEENRSAAATRADDCDASVGTGGGNLEGADTCGFRDATDKQNADPKLAALAANGGPTRTMALATDSPAVNAAGADACLATDQRGVERTASACDSGAYELVPPGTQPVTKPPTAAGGVLGAEASSERCLSVRRFKIRLRVPRGEEVRRAIVLVNGNPVSVKRGKRLTAVVDLRGLRKARYKVKITLHLKGGGKVSGVRRYWTCTPAIRWKKPPKV